jgi:hypothetical protein
MKRQISAVVLTGGLILLSALPANAAVVFDAECGFTPSNSTGACGFVGKGDVQTALGYSNAMLQSAVNGETLAFSVQQNATQGLTQSGSQTATQSAVKGVVQTGQQVGVLSGTRSGTQTLSCPQGQHTRTGTQSGTASGTMAGSREGTITGTRSGSRDGQRSGSRTGTLTATYSWALSNDGRKKVQYTGFLLTGLSGESEYTGHATWEDFAWGDYGWGDYSWGEPAWDGDYVWSDWVWSDTWQWGQTVWDPWTTTSGGNVENACLDSNGDPVATATLVTAYAPAVSGAISPGAVTDGVPVDVNVVPGEVMESTPVKGATVYGPLAPTGPATLYVNDVPLN